MSFPPFRVGSPRDPSFRDRPSSWLDPLGCAGPGSFTLANRGNAAAAFGDGDLVDSGRRDQLGEERTAAAKNARAAAFGFPSPQILDTDSRVRRQDATVITDFGHPRVDWRGYLRLLSTNVSSVLDVAGRRRFERRCF